MKLYKLTNNKGQTKNGTQWGEGVTHKARGKGYKLCTDRLIHAYAHPLLAVFFDPIHGEFGNNAQLWEAKTSCNKIINDGTKIGVKSLTTIHQIPLPVITMEQRTEIAIRRVIIDYQEATYTAWANSWLTNNNRSRSAAASAARSARSAAESAAASAARSAASAAESAAASAAWSAAWSAARSAAWSAARSAESAAELLSIIKMVCEPNHEG